MATRWSGRIGVTFFRAKEKRILPMARSEKAEGPGLGLDSQMGGPGSVTRGSKRRRVNQGFEHRAVAAAGAGFWENPGSAASSPFL
jgi:hypothetical protein